VAVCTHAGQPPAVAWHVSTPPFAHCVSPTAQEPGHEEASLASVFASSDASVASGASAVASSALGASAPASGGGEAPSGTVESGAALESLPGAASAVGAPLSVDASDGALS